MSRLKKVPAKDTRVRRPLVVDNGSGDMKCGFSEDSAPRTIFPTVVGRPKKDRKLPIGMDPSALFIGDEALAKRGVLKLSYPIKRGMIDNWKKMEEVWIHTFSDELRLDPSLQPVLMTESPLTPKNNRERMTSVMFETFKVPSLYIGVQAVLSLYASGRTSGCIVDCGYGVSDSVPIFEGYALPHAIIKTEIAGKDIDDFIGKVFLERRTKIDREVAREIKEKYGYVALDYDAELRKDEKIELQLPDGKTISSGSERFRAPEILFQPSLMNNSPLSGIHESAYSAIYKCEEDFRNHLFQNVVVSGGSCMIKGFSERFSSEMKKLGENDNNRIKCVVAAAEKPEWRKNSVWLGGSILSSCSSFNNMWITKEDFDDYGKTIVHRKCF